jgi:hypothetical protein
MPMATPAFGTPTYTYVVMLHGFPEAWQLAWADVMPFMPDVSENFVAKQ